MGVPFAGLSRKASALLGLMVPCRFIMRRIATALLSLLISTLALAGRLGTPVGEVSVIVELEGEPLAGSASSSATRSSVRPAGVFLPLPDRKREIAQQQAGVEQQVVALGGTVVDHFDTLLNALVVRIDSARVAELSRLPGVDHVQEEKHFTPQLSTSVPWIGAPKGWSLPGGPWTGSGVRIAIVDSGIDYLHASLGGSGDPDEFANNDPTVIESGTFPTARVVGGFDFVGDNYDSRGVSGSTTERPDADPLDTFANGHGSHVAGIAAGNGVLTNGLPYTGPFSSAIDFSRFSVGPGVAPEAKLYAYKVFGASGSTASRIIVKALERCLDPNQDGSFADKVDVVNLSLGSPFGIMNGRDSEAEAVNRLVNQNVIVVVAAGNSGNTVYSLGSPGIANRGITVANSLDNGASFSTIKVVAPAAVAGDYACAEGAFTPPLATHGPVTAQVVQTDPPLACEALKNAAALQGKIALIDRGTCFFVDKIRAVQNAGAIGVIVVNNVDGPPIEMGGRGDTSDIRIPGVMISQLDGIILKGQLGNGLTATLDAFAAVARPELADQISDSSARGPSVGDNRLKPDLAAPGTGIISVKAGTGFEGTSQTGTSMSSPHIAGVAALMRQARPTWTVEDIKAALMNTCAPMQTGSKIPYPESRVGAGRVSVDEALQTQVVAKADTGQGDISLSFGVFEVADPVSQTRNVRVSNLGAVPVTFQIRTSSTLTNAGVTVTPLADTITVPGKSSVLVGVRLDIDPAQLAIVRDATSGGAIGDKFRYFLNEASGQVWFTSNSQQLHVPWQVTARPMSRFKATASRVGVPAGAHPAVPLPTRGTTSHPQPLVSAWQLGYINPSPAGSAGSLAAAGAASDYARTHDLSQTRLYFGIATGGRWSTPQYELVGLEVEIDTDGDGNAEFLLLNASGGNLNGQGVDPDLANDALLTLVADMNRDENFFIDSSPLNVLTPDFRDTSAFQNRVVIHSVNVSALGLSAANSSIRYRVTTTDASSNSQTESPWIDFSITQPLIDPTAYGLNGSPLFDEGAGVRVDVDRTAAVAKGFSAANPLPVLLLHQHDEAGQQVETVNLDLSTADSDGDGLSDDWELEYFGDLSATGGGDADGDGRTNAAELAAGTNPLDVQVFTPVAGTGVIQWKGIVGRSFTVERADRLDGAFTPVFRHIVGINGTNSVVDPLLSSGDRPLYYRIRPE